MNMTDCRITKNVLRLAKVSKHSRESQAVYLICEQDSIKNQERCLFYCSFIYIFGKYCIYYLGKFIKYLMLVKITTDFLNKIEK